MIKKIAAGTVIAALALAGCFDKNEIRGLKTADKSMTHDIDYLKARVEAVETACLQLNDKIDALETRLESKSDRSKEADGASSREVSAGEPAESNAAPTDTAATETAPVSGSSSHVPTRDSFSYAITGMKPETITSMFGEPDKVRKVADNETWSYRRIKLQRVHGGSETTPAMVVFKNGRVTHGLLTQDVQYNLQTEKKAPLSTNAADQAEQ